MNIWHAVLHALELTGSMTWEITWALILGFTLSAAVQAVVRRESITRLMGSSSPKALAISSGLGAASSSCSYAAVALARSLFRKGANFAAAMAFQIASTNLVIELGIILVLLMGWEFAAAEFTGGPVMIIVLALLFHFFLKPRLLDEARQQAAQGVAGSMEGHAAMDMTVGGSGSLWRRLTSTKGFTSVSHIFVMEWAAVLRDIVIGLLIAGAVAAWVPETFWRSFFLVDHPLLAKIWGPIIGPVVAVLSFVCSIGNVPLAAVLWNGGISFGGVVSFIFADLLILPVLVIYRKYYGARMAAFLAGTFYLASVVAGYVVEILFGVLGLVPAQRHARVEMAQISWNYTTYLNIAFLLLAAVLVVRFLRSGGPAMMKMMGGGPDDMAGGDHAGHDQMNHSGSQVHHHDDSAQERPHSSDPHHDHR
ncbi:permease [uncultured Friedmanniella sp.]|uniref:permease n=1 Tax=uncultured Friedmanniella sp. TaxID=335381 RepID=UPI0035CBA2F3